MPNQSIIMRVPERDDHSLSFSFMSSQTLFLFTCHASGVARGHTIIVTAY